MAQTNQIVPEFPFPYVEMHVNDYTLVQDNTDEVVTENPASIQAYAFTSGKGIDNVWIKKTSRSSAEKTYGKSNFKKYGQPYMQALNVLDKESSHVWMMRVMPDDATYANTVVYAAYGQRDGKFAVKLYSKTFDEVDGNKITNINDLVKYIENYKVDDTEDGFTAVPLFVFSYVGRGKCGNNYSMRVVKAPTYEKEFGITFYNFQAIDSENGVVVDTNYIGGITSSIKYGSETATFIDDILSFANEGSYPVNIKTFDENVDTIFEKYQEFMGTATEDGKKVAAMTSDQFDIISGKIPGTAVDLPNFIPSSKDDTVPTDWTVVDFSSVSGVKLEQGDDGTSLDDKITITIDDEEKTVTQRTVCYMNAYNGTYDKKILSPHRMRINTLWDANYDKEVKFVLAELASNRGDLRCQLDAGIISSLSEDKVRELIDTYAPINDHRVSIDIHNYMVKDPSTQKKVNVTISYYLAAAYVDHVTYNGTHIPFVKQRCQLEGHIKNTLLPIVDEYDTSIKTKLYENRFNYFEAYEENIFRRACQNTTQKANTDLLEENDSRLLLEMQDYCDKRVDEHLYSFSNPETRSDFVSVTKILMQGIFGPRVQEFDLYFGVSQFEAEHSIIHLYLSVTFYGLDKQAIVEIDINKREYASLETIEE